MTPILHARIVVDVSGGEFTSEVETAIERLETMIDRAIAELTHTQPQLKINRTEA